jgi:hypothetical protein
MITSSVQTYSDERINALGDRYLELRLYQVGITFEQFLTTPQRYDLREMMAGLRRVHQRLVEDMEDTVAHLPCRGGAVMEPMRHRRNPRRSVMAFFDRRSR